MIQLNLKNSNLEKLKIFTTAKFIFGTPRFSPFKNHFVKVIDQLKISLTFFSSCRKSIPRLTSEEIQRHRGKRARKSIVVESYDLDEIEKVDLEKPEEDAMMSGDGDARQNTQKTTKRNFFSGNPFVEVTEGILHLFKEDKSSPAPGAVADAGSSSSSTSGVGRSDMVCMLAVPAVLTSHELLNFIAPCSPDIRHVRIVRDRTPNQYMVLLKFRFV